MAAFEERLHAAAGKHLAGATAAAEILYRELVEDFPEKAQARHYLGFLLQQQGRLAEAAEEMEASLALDEGHAERHFSLAMVHSGLGHPHLAEKALRRAIELDPQQYFYHTNLGAICEQSGKPEQAESSYLEAAEISPEIADAHFLLAELYLRLGRHADARKRNWLGIAASHGKGFSKMVHAQSLHETGKMEEACSLLEKWHAEEPDHPVPIHLLCAYRGDEIPERCSENYVERTFDAFAENFDNVLGRLKYSGPALVKAFLEETLPAGQFDILDLGCGTGLTGASLKPHASLLEGVDLSAKMLEKARERGIYDRLHRSDLSDFLERDAGSRDIVVSMDTLIYLGHLEPVIGLVAASLKPGGWFLFSTECLEEEVPYRLDISGRYRHSPAFLRKILEEKGFEIARFEEVTIRMESGSPIRGHFVCARKRGE
ncbi:MAG: tetratricopeptide repeat protein [Burkholderiales bacterium]|nr:tetratricopeptide repeat protein [Burkholderiales bacterium]